MTLYLTSLGLENSNVADRFKKVLFKKGLNNASFLVVSVQENELDAFYLRKTLNELKNAGVFDIDIFELKDSTFKIEKDYDVIYVCGGNTYVYMDRIRKTGLNEYIINSVKSGKSIYVGVSAGSIIAGPDISIASLGDNNDIGLSDLSGLGLTNVVVSPHYCADLKVKNDDYKDKSNYQVFEISDADALLIEYSDDAKEPGSIEKIEGGL